MQFKQLTLNNKQFHSWKLQPTWAKGNVAAVLLHGAGTSSSTRALPLAQEFSDQGVPVISLDFFGHGKTGGSLEETNLIERTSQAQAAIDFWLAKNTALVLLRL